MRSEEVVVIEKQGHRVRVKGDWGALDIVTKCVIARKHTAVYSKPYGVAIESLPNAPFALEIPNGIETLAGFEQSIEKHLKSAGITVQKKLLRPDAKLHAPLKQTKGCESKLAGFISANERGTINIRRGQRAPSNVVLEAVKAFPELRILVISKYRKDAQYMSKRLKRSGVQHEYYIDNAGTNGAEKVCVSTYFGANKSKAFPNWFFDIIFVLQPVALANFDWLPELLDSAGGSPRRQTQGARIFGIQVDDVRLSPYQAHQKEALYGISNFQFVSTENIEANVEFRSLGRKATRQMENLEQWVVSNKARNRKGVREAIRAQNGLAEGVGDGKSVVVTALNKEHCMMLQRFFPKKIRFRLENDMFKSSDGKYLIVANGDLENLNPNKLHTIVRLDGTGAALQFAETYYFCNVQKEELRVIDFDDRFAHGILTKNRAISYRLAGWKVEGGPKLSDADHVRSAKDSRARDLFMPYSRRYDDVRYTGKNFKLIDRSDPEYHYQRRRIANTKSLNKKYGSESVELEHIADRDRLFDAFRTICREGGVGAGVDGIGVLDVSPTEFGDIAETAAIAILEKRWRPQPTRRVLIPKPGTNEKRELNIQVLLDRVVSRTLLENIQPFFEPLFSTHSYGFRPRLSIKTILAHLLRDLELGERRVIVNVDIRKAFDNIRIDDVLGIHGKLSNPTISNEVIDLVHMAIRARDNFSEVGIMQGSAYSPFAMNLLLDLIHDTPFKELGISPSWYRYADNLVYLAKDVTEGELIVESVSRLLNSAQLQLKQGKAVFDLTKGESTDILGFNIEMNDKGPVFRIPKLAQNLEKLLSCLKRCLTYADCQHRANNMVAQWGEQRAPALVNGGRDFLDHIVQESRKFGLSLNPVAIESNWTNSKTRWSKYPQRSRSRKVRESSKDYGDMTSLLDCTVVGGGR